jgi:hypothetical protein
MRLALRIFGFVLGILALAIVGFTGWIVIARHDALQLASAATARTVCSNVFMAGRDADATFQADLLALGHPLLRLLKIDVSAADHRVDAGFFGFVAESRARATGRGSASSCDWAGHGTVSSFCRRASSTICARLSRSPMRATALCMVADWFG